MGNLACSRVVLLSRTRFLLMIRHGSLVELIHVEEIGHREQEARAEYRGSRGDQGHAPAPKLVEMAQAFVGELLARRRFGEHVR